MGNTQDKLPEKNTHYAVKEHFAEDHPVWTQDGFEIVKIKVDELFTTDPEELRKIGERVLEGLSKDNILIIQNNNEFNAKVKAAYEETKKFLSQSQDEKDEYSAEQIDKKRAYYSGYSLVYFENRDNKRDKEWRDVFQIRYCEEGHIPWPSDTLKQASRQLYEAQWSICVQVLHALALAININPLDLLALAVGKGNTEKHLFQSKNTNLCLFHYYDKEMSYKTPQKCMIHKDHGLLTLLPKSDLPGLELLHPRLKQWIPMEQFIDDNDVLLYCGEALSVVTNSLVVPATHRVVRIPQKERYSMPFEAKPNDDAILRNLVHPEKDTQPTTFDGLTKRLQWERIQKQVNRTDGIEPTEDGIAPQQAQGDGDETKPDLGQAQHDVQLPSISVK